MLDGMLPVMAALSKLNLISLLKNVNSCLRVLALLVNMRQQYNGAL